MDYNVNWRLKDLRIFKYHNCSFSCSSFVTLLILVQLLQVILYSVAHWFKINFKMESHISGFSKVEETLSLSFIWRSIAYLFTWESSRTNTSNLNCSWGRTIFNLALMASPMKLALAENIELGLKNTWIVIGHPNSMRCWSFSILNMNMNIK